MKKGFFWMLLLPGLAQADISRVINVRTIDGTVTNYPFQLKVTNGSLTDNHDGTMTLTTSGSGTGGICGSNPAGIQFVDVNGCTWCETIDTSGNFSTVKVSCPPTPASCTTGMSLGLLLSITCP